MSTQAKQEDSTAVRKIKAQAADMEIIEVHGRKHVIRPFSRGIGEEANYMGTKKAWCGNLRINESLLHFKMRWIQMKTDSLPEHKK